MHNKKMKLYYDPKPIYPDINSSRRRKKRKKKKQDLASTMFGDLFLGQEIV